MQLAENHSGNAGGCMFVRWTHYSQGSGKLPEGNELQYLVWSRCVHKFHIYLLFMCLILKESEKKCTSRLESHNMMVVIMSIACSLVAHPVPAQWSYSLHTPSWCWFPPLRQVWISKCLDQQDALHFDVYILQHPRSNTEKRGHSSQPWNLQWTHYFT